ncbi:uncharacterized protein LOC110038868 [Phalaenopsis equestris]|uniref:uncharacterized protein LOC110038868 n=1 Tax=Phalaenopsis equestris TaxID=78828 RepID=UPI0009E27115|nr:uncharacterized protein LOC110038868 [Phalaenopsis equestris]
MDLFFEAGDGRCFKEEIWFFSTVLEIKQKLHKRYGFPISHQTLLFNGKIMEDKRDIEYYNIIQGSRILLRLPPEPKPAAKADQPETSTSGGGRRTTVTVLVPTETFGTMRVAMEVNLADNVSELKKELWRMRHQIYGFCLPVEGFFFIFKQNVMEEDRSFRWHGVKTDDVIEIFNGSVADS